MANLSRLEPTLRADHTALILFDCLHGFLYPPDLARRKRIKDANIVSNLTRLLRAARRAGMTTFYPCVSYAPDGSDVVQRLTDTDNDLRPVGERTAKAMGAHMKRGSKNSEIVAPLKPKKGDVIIPKHKWNAFLYTDLEFHLRCRNLDTIILAGGSTDVGIAATAYGARDLDLGLVVVKDACHALYPESSAFFLNRVFPRMGRVRTVDEVTTLMKVKL